MSTWDFNDKDIQNIFIKRKLVFEDILLYYLNENINLDGDNVALFY